MEPGWRGENEGGHMNMHIISKSKQLKRSTISAAGQGRSKQDSMLGNPWPADWHHHIFMTTSVRHGAWRDIYMTTSSTFGVRSSLQDAWRSS
jgi:hypothetical protein